MNPSRARNAAFLLILFVALPVFGNWEEGLAAFKAGRFDEAATKFRAVVEESPDSPAGYYMLGLTLMRQKRAAESLEHLAKAVELGPDDKRYLLTYAQAKLAAGKPDDALGILAKEDPKAIPEAHREAFGQLVVKAATESRNTGAALSALDKLAATDRRSKTLWLAVAHVAQKAKRYDRAFSALATAYDLDRRDEDLGRRAVHTAFAAAQKANGNGREDWYGKALETARKWAETTRSAEAYLMAGQAQMGAKDYADARTWFEKATSAAPNDPQPPYEQARCDLALKEPEAALGHLRTAASRSPDADMKRQILLAEGFAYRHLEDFVKARQAFEKAGDGAKATEMEELQERKEENALFEKEKAECKKKLTELEKLKVEMADLKGTDAWAQLESDTKAVAAACAAHLKDG